MEILKKQGFKAGSETPFFEDNHVGFLEEKRKPLLLDQAVMMLRTSWRSLWALSGLEERNDIL